MPLMQVLGGKEWSMKSVIIDFKGCDHMTCRCKYEFCYKCGGIYGKCPCIN